ncbi:MAG: hypothetical protein GY754_37430 [bacterium]|nr:hypothetical protein [bacterium]
MKCCRFARISVILLFLFLFTGISFAQDSEKNRSIPYIHDFHMLDINLLNAGISSFKHDPTIGIGATWGTNLGKRFLLHARALCAYPKILGSKMDLGLGYIIHGRGSLENYTREWWSDNGNSRTYYRAEDTCKTNTIHSVDVGVRQYLYFYDTSEGTRDYEARCYDTIAYFGYRYDYILDRLMTFRQVGFSVHGMVGQVYQTIYDSTAAVQNQEIKKIAYGFKGKVKWWLVEFEGGYFDNEFYVEANLNFVFTFF